MVDVFENEVTLADSECSSRCEEPIKKVYSIIPDLATGWKPKNLKIPAPIIITYKSQLITQLLQYYIKQPERIVFLGPRHTNSFSFHQKTQHRYTMKYGISADQIPNLIKNDINDKQFSPLRKFEGMNPLYSKQIQFDSNFESGNLDLVIKTGSNEYNLFLRPDTNTCGHMQWFYFKVRNTKQKQTVKFNICNNKKYKTLYQRGMKPYVFSKHLKATKNVGWVQSGEEVSYKKMFIKEQDEEKIVDGIPKKVYPFQNYFNLSFEYTFQSDKDEVEFAYCPPYTYSDMKTHLSQLKRIASNQSSTKQSFIKETKLCNSLSGVEIPLLTITNPQIDDSEKVCIILIGRIHPGQSNGSYVMQGFLNYITSEVCRHLRDKIVFKVIPMLNPDGVIFGNYRTGLSGKDLNRQFKVKSEELFPEIYQFKSFIRKLKEENKFKLAYFLDFHGHSMKKNVFVYGPEYDIWSIKYQKSKLLPRLIANKTEAFRYKSCLFKVAPFKRTTARAFMLSFIPYCYTVESSVGIYRNKKDENVAFVVEKWQEMGYFIACSLGEIILKNIQENKEIQRRKKAKAKKINLKTDSQKQNNQADEIKSLQKRISLSSSKKYLNPIRNMKKRPIEMSQEYPQIDQQECQSDRFSEGNSDCQSQENDLPKLQYEILRGRIIKLIENFETLVVGSKKKNFIITDKRQTKSKMKTKKSKQIRKRSIQQMHLVPSLKHKMSKINFTTQKKISNLNMSSEGLAPQIYKLQND